MAAAADAIDRIIVQAAAPAGLGDDLEVPRHGLCEAGQAEGAAIVNPLLYGLEALEEVVEVVTSPWVYALNPLFAPLLPAPRVVHPPPQIVIVDTWLHKSPLHWFWTWYLERQGFAVSLAYFPLKELSIPESAAALQRYADENALHDVVLVGISTGALTCYLYAQQRQGWDRVKHLVAIGAPFGGTEAALFLYPDPHARALLPRSPLVRRIAQEPVQHPERITSLAALADEMVPRWSSRLPGVRQEIIDVVGHNNLHSACEATYRRGAQLATQAGVLPSASSQQQPNRVK